jgi:hypothetical protein
VCPSLFGHDEMKLVIGGERKLEVIGFRTPCDYHILNVKSFTCARFKGEINHREIFAKSCSPCPVTPEKTMLGRRRYVFILIVADPYEVISGTSL